MEVALIRYGLGSIARCSRQPEFALMPWLQTAAPSGAVQQSFLITPNAALQCLAAV